MDRWLGVGLAVASLAVGGCADDSSTGTGTSQGSSGQTGTGPGTGAGPTTAGSGSGSSSGGSTTTGPAMCGAGTSLCVPEPPSGWTGPSIVRASAGARCTGDYDQVGPDLIDGLTAPPGACECTCAAPTGVSCASPNPMLLPSATFSAWGNNQSCAGGATDTDVTIAGSCATLPSSYLANTSGFEHAESFLFGNGSCAPTPGADGIDPPELAEAALLCTTNTFSGGCTQGELCVPQTPDGEQVCVWQSGESNCPTAYPNRRVWFDDVVDTRGCDDCTCGFPSGRCDGNIQFFSDSGCTQLIGRIEAEIATCQTMNPSAFSAIRGRVIPGDPTFVTCPPLRAPIGSADLVEPIVVCCL